MKSHRSDAVPGIRVELSLIFSRGTLEIGEDNKKQIVKIYGFLVRQILVHDFSVIKNIITNSQSGIGVCAISVVQRDWTNG